MKGADNGIRLCKLLGKHLGTKKNPSALIDEAEGQQIAILNRNRPTAYLVPADTYAAILEKLEDYELGLLIQARQDEKKQAVEVDIDDL